MSRPGSRPRPARPGPAGTGPVGAGVALGLVLALAACTDGAPSPTPSSVATTTVTPAAYVQQALDLIGTGLQVDGAYPGLREIAVRKAAPATTTAGTYDALRTALLGVGQNPGDLITREAVARVPASPGQPSATTSEGVTVVSLPGFADLSARPGSGTWTPAEVTYARNGSAALANAARDTTCGWVVDLRGNGTTDVPVLVGSVAALLPRGPVLARVDRDGARSDLVLTDSGLTVGDTRVLPLDPVEGHDDEPVVVLQDSGTTRAGEAVVLALRSRPGAHTIGSPTFGAATDGTTTSLPDGALLYVARWHLADPTGVVTPGPLVPQESAPAGAEPDAARAWLRARCGG